MGLDPSQLADFENLSPKELQKEAVDHHQTWLAMASWKISIKMKVFLAREITHTPSHNDKTSIDGWNPTDLWKVWGSFSVGFTALY